MPAAIILPKFQAAPAPKIKTAPFPAPRVTGSRGKKISLPRAAIAAPKIKTIVFAAAPRLRIDWQPAPAVAQALTPSLGWQFRQQAQSLQPPEGFIVIVKPIPPAATENSAAAAMTADGPLRPMSHHKLWEWYKATGRSYAQFLSDHGQP